MKEDNRKDCQWIEVFMNAYGDRIAKCLCHLKPESKRVHLEKDCPKCPNYVKCEDKEEPTTY